MTILDSRDLDTELTDLIDAGPGQDIEDIRRRKALRDLRTETEAEGWQWGIAFIPDDEFTDYARELAEDIGAIDREARWPSCYINWDAATDALRMDYSSTQFEGTDYLYREA